jgi:hypothetical protein
MDFGNGKLSIAMYLHMSMTVFQRFGATLLALFALSMSAQAQVTSLTMVSDPGDYIGGGQFYFYTPTDGPFSAQQNYARCLLSFNTPSYEHWWYLDFAAQNNQPLTVGHAGRSASVPGHGST